MSGSQSFLKTEKAVEKESSSLEDEIPEDFEKRLKEYMQYSELLNKPGPSPVPVDPEAQLRKIMDFILPGREYVSEGKIWIEKTSTVPTTRLDLLSLHEKFEASLIERNAKMFGICPIRRDLFEQLFDEIIRQVTINCAERGLLLLRIKHEFQLTIVSYQSVLESAIAYGIRKAIETEVQRSSVDEQAQNDRTENIALKKKIEQLEQKSLQEKLLREQEIELMVQNLKEENNRLNQNCKILKGQLQTILQLEQEMKQNDEK
uniref:Axonemal dynein light chain p33 n=1 Tax=Strongyloides stercoralis TaxID=6248 RepID=A0A0K0EJH9_STRER